MTHGNEPAGKAGEPSKLGQSGAMRAPHVREYTCGFLFWRMSVLLVRKNHPSWMDGLVNGIGGLCHVGEDPLDCMRREFSEEVVWDVPQPDWQFFCHETGRDYSVHYFRAELEMPERPVPPMQNDRSELLGWAFVPNLGTSVGGVTLVGNLRWLIPMSQDWRGVRARVVADRDIVEKPTW